MPFPLIPLLVLAATAGGVATGVGGAHIGKKRSARAKDIADENEKYISNQRYLYEKKSDKHIGTLIGYSKRIRAMIGDDVKLHPPKALSSELSIFLDRAFAPWHEVHDGRSINDIMKLSHKESEALRNVVVSSRFGPLAGPATQNGAAIYAGALYAKKGIAHAVDASKNLKKIESWSGETKENIENIMRSLDSDISSTSEDFESFVIPSIRLALKKNDTFALSQYVFVADELERAARERISLLKKSAES